MTQLQNETYTVDVVLCIDGTASMAKIIDKVKERAKAFPDLYIDAMANAKKNPGAFRIKVIVFRDYAVDGEIAMVESPDFYNLNDPEEQMAFEKFINDIEPQGGGDAEENALEAIVLALRSKWTTTGGKYRRHAILLFTDAPALPLRESSRMANPKYPKGVPSDLAELQKMYYYGDQEYAPYYSPSRGRLIIFAPASADSTWGAIRTWTPRTWVVPTKENGGCEDIDLEDALAVLTGSF